MSVRRDEYEKVMAEYSERLARERERRCAETGDLSFTKFEALVPELVNVLRPEKKCRVVMEYDPAEERVRFYREFPPGNQEEAEAEKMPVAHFKDGRLNVY